MHFDRLDKPYVLVHSICWLQVIHNSGPSGLLNQSLRFLQKSPGLSYFGPYSCSVRSWGQILPKHAYMTSLTCKIYHILETITLVPLFLRACQFWSSTYAPLFFGKAWVPKNTCSTKMLRVIFTPWTTLLLRAILRLSVISWKYFVINIAHKNLKLAFIVFSSWLIST